MSTMTEHAENFDAEVNFVDRTCVNLQSNLFLQLWREYMLTMVAYSTQKGLQIGSSAISLRRSQLLSSQPDLRRKAAADLRSVWFRLSSQ